MTDRSAKKGGKKSAAKTASGSIPQAAEPTKLDRLADRLKGADGATLADLMAVTGWQAHSVRGAIAGALKKKGHAITSDKVDGVRRYRIGAQQ